MSHLNYISIKYDDNVHAVLQSLPGAVAVNIWENYYHIIAPTTMITAVGSCFQHKRHVESELIVNGQSFARECIVRAYQYHLDRCEYPVKEWLQTRLSQYRHYNVPAGPAIVADERLPEEFNSFYSRYLRKTSNVDSTGISPYAPGNLAPAPVGSISGATLDGVSVTVYEHVPRRDCSQSPVVVWCHGGGFVYGHARSEHSVVTRIAEAIRCVVLSVEYGLAPECQLPQIYDQVMRVVKWCRRSGRGFALDPNKIIVAGNSAGGLLALITAIEDARKSGMPRIRGVVANAPVINSIAEVQDAGRSQNISVPGLTADRMLWYQQRYLKDPRSCDSWYANLNSIPADDFRQLDLPQTVLYVPEVDILHSEGKAFGQKLTSQNGVGKHEVHECLPHVHGCGRTCGEVPTLC